MILFPDCEHFKDAISIAKERLRDFSINLSMLRDKNDLEEVKFLKRRAYKYGSKNFYTAIHDRLEGEALEEQIKEVVIHLLMITKGMGSDNARITSFVKEYVYVDHDRKRVVIPRTFIIGDAKLSVLAEDLEFEGDLDISGWTNLFELPLNLYVTGKLTINEKHRKDAQRLKKEGKIERFEIK